MQKYFENIKEQIAENGCELVEATVTDTILPVRVAMDIVNQVSEEYKKETPTLSYSEFIKTFQNREMERFLKKNPPEKDGWEIVFEGKCNNGWIPVSSGKLPIGEEYEYYDQEEDITYHKHVWVHAKEDNVPYCVAYYDTDTWFCAVSNEPLAVDYWKPITPYQPKGE